MKMVNWKAAHSPSIIPNYWAQQMVIWPKDNFVNRARQVQKSTCQKYLVWKMCHRVVLENQQWDFKRDFNLSSPSLFVLSEQTTKGRKMKATIDLCAPRRKTICFFRFAWKKSRNLLHTFFHQLNKVIRQ